MTVSFFFQTLITGISNGMVAYLMVAGVSLIISGMNMVNFGQGAFYVLGTYLTYTIAEKLGFIPALVIVPLIVAAIGYFVEKATRPLFGKNMLYIMLLTYGVAYMICDIMVMVWGYSIRLLALPKFLQGGVQLFGINFPIYYLFEIAVAALIAFAFWYMINRTKLGMLTRAIISDRPMVANLGVNVNQMFSILFMIGIGIAGLGGRAQRPHHRPKPQRGSVGLWQTSCRSWSSAACAIWTAACRRRCWSAWSMRSARSTCRSITTSCRRR